MAARMLSRMPKDAVENKPPQMRPARQSATVYGLPDLRGSCWQAVPGKGQGESRATKRTMTHS